MLFMRVCFDFSTIFTHRRPHITVPPVPAGRRIKTLPVPGSKIGPFINILWLLTGLLIMIRICHLTPSSPDHRFSENSEISHRHKISISQFINQVICYTNEEIDTRAGLSARVSHELKKYYLVDLILR